MFFAVVKTQNNFIGWYDLVTFRPQIPSWNLFLIFPLSLRNGFGRMTLRGNLNFAIILLGYLPNFSADFTFNEQ